MTTPHAPGVETEPDWTPRQREVLQLLVRGRSNAEIATELGISLDGAKWHVREILQKLGVDSREDAAEYWRRRNGLLPRLWRVARGVFALPAWTKWLVGGSALAATAVAAVVIAWPGTATAPESSASATPTAGVTATALDEAPFPGLYPYGTTTGIAIVDKVVSAVITGDPAEIAPLLDFTSVGCVDGSETVVTPVCPTGNTPGDMLPAMYSSHCGEGGYTLASQFTTAAIMNQFAAPGAYLFAVGTLNDGPRQNGARYLIVLQAPALSETGGSQPPLILAVSVNGIVGYTDGCFRDARGFLDEPRSITFTPDGFVLPPRAGAIHAPLPLVYDDPATTGVASVDSAIKAILSGGPLGEDLFHWIPAPCSSNPPPSGDTPLCPAGTPDGSPVGRILVGGCEPGAVTIEPNPGTWAPPWQPGGSSPRLYAVTRTAPDDLLDGQYVAIFVDDGDLAFTPSYVGIDENGIVSMFTGACRSNAVVWASQQPGFLLPPRSS